MARALRIQYAGAYYHVTCRGNERRAIYRDDQDRRLFKEKLKQSMDIYGVYLHGYVLMSNHFHLLLQTPQGNLSQFMRHFNITYDGCLRCVTCRIIILWFTGLRGVSLRRQTALRVHIVLRFFSRTSGCLFSVRITFGNK